jgi:hypothetical protein
MTDTGRLWAAVDELTRAVPGQVTRDDGTRVRLDAVSLWDQLVGSASQSGSSHASGKPGSRPPVALAALALRLEAQELVRSTLNLMREEHRYDFAKDLRRVDREDSRLVGSHTGAARRGRDRAPRPRPLHHVRHGQAP